MPFLGGQVLDDGRLTDSQGKTIDFSNSVIIMTSNLGSQYLKTEKSFESAEMKIKQAAMSHFPPEFINRLDGLLVFNQLNRRILQKIVQLQV